MIIDKDSSQPSLPPIYNVSGNQLTMSPFGGINRRNQQPPIAATQLINHPSTHLTRHSGVSLSIYFISIPFSCPRLDGMESIEVRVLWDIRCKSDPLH